MSDARYRERVSTRVRLLVALVPLVLALGIGGALLAVTGDEDSERTASDQLSMHPVAGNFESDDTRIAECTEQRCWEQAFGNLAYRAGPKPALKVFDRRIATDPAVEAGCHRIVHTIGSAALARYDGNVAKAFSEGSASCASGYYHGILEKALIGASTKGELAAAVGKLCDDASVRRNTYVAYQCVHGLGHGLMIRSGYNLPLSLEICEQLETGWDQTSCDGGVFMENYNTSYGFKSPYVKKNDPLYPCSIVKERHKLYCYLLITDNLLPFTSYDWAETARLCTTVEKDWRATCFQSYGRSASGTARLDAQRLDELCAFAEGQWEGECIYGAVRDIVNTDTKPARAKVFCELVAERWRGRCYYGAGTILQTLSASQEELRRACTTITTRYLEQCMLVRAG